MPFLYKNAELRLWSTLLFFQVQNQTKIARFSQKRAKIRFFKNAKQVWLHLLLNCNTVRICSNKSKNFNNQKKERHSGWNNLICWNKFFSLKNKIRYLKVLFSVEKFVPPWKIYYPGGFLSVKAMKSRMFPKNGEGYQENTSGQ